MRGEDAAGANLGYIEGRLVGRELLGRNPPAV
jgi:hypothetical protein